MAEKSRVFVPTDCFEGERIRFPEECRHHLRTVLRLRPGDRLRVTDGEGREFLAKLQGSQAMLEAVVLNETRPRRESPLAVTLIQSVPKRGLMERVIRQAVELGVHEIWPAATSRTIPDGKTRRLERWRKVAEGAVAQSGRTVIPLVRNVQGLESCFSALEGKRVKYILDREGVPLGSGVAGVSPPKQLVLAVGPEGGWGPGEIEAAGAQGFTAVSLGPRTLRTETAGPAAMALVQFLFGDLGGGYHSGGD